MDHMLDIPKDRKPVAVMKLCLIMGMTALLYILIVTRIGSAAEAVLAAPGL